MSRKRKSPTTERIDFKSAGTVRTDYSPRKAEPLKAPATALDRAIAAEQRVDSRELLPLVEM